MEEADGKQVAAVYRDIFVMALNTYGYRHHMSIRMPIYFTLAFFALLIGTLIIRPLMRLLGAIGLSLGKQQQPEGDDHLNDIDTEDKLFAAIYEEGLKHYYTAEQRADPAFKCAQAEDSAGWCLAQVILDRFKLNSVQLESLLTLHRLRFEKFPGQASIRPLNVILAVGAVAANTVPEEAFQAAGLGNYYDLFQLAIAATVLYLLLMFAVPIIYRRVTQRHSFRFIRFLEEVLQDALVIHNFSSNASEEGQHRINPREEPSREPNQEP